MVNPAELIKIADEIDNRLGPIPGRTADRIAGLLRQVASDISRPNETALDAMLWFLKAMRASGSWDVATLDRAIEVATSANRAFVNPDVDVSAGMSTWALTLTKLLGELEAAESAYRAAHDIHGDGSREAGRAWDLMRRAGDNARNALSDARAAIAPATGAA